MMMVFAISSGKGEGRYLGIRPQTISPAHFVLPPPEASRFSASLFAADPASALPRRSASGIICQRRQRTLHVSGFPPLLLVAAGRRGSASLRRPGVVRARWGQSSRFSTKDWTSIFRSTSATILACILNTRLPLPAIWWVHWYPICVALRWREASGPDSGRSTCPYLSRAVAKRSHVPRDAHGALLVPSMGMWWDVVEKIARWLQEFRWLASHEGQRQLHDTTTAIETCCIMIFTCASRCDSLCRSWHSTVRFRGSPDARSGLHDAPCRTISKR